MSGRFDEIIKMNKKVSLKYGVGEGVWFLIKIFLLYLGIFIMFSFVIPSNNVKNILSNSKLMILIIFIMSLYQVIVRYKWMKRRLDVSGVIRDINYEDKIPLITIRQGKARSKSMVDISEKKLEFVKFFSTIPFLIYGLSLLVNMNKSINDMIFTDFLDLTIIEVLFYMALLSTIIYVSVFIKLFKEYKDNKDDLLAYERAEIRIIGEKEVKSLNVSSVSVG